MFPKNLMSLFQLVVIWSLVSCSIDAARWGRHRSSFAMVAVLQVRIVVQTSWGATEVWRTETTTFSLSGWLKTKIELNRP